MKGLFKSKPRTPPDIVRQTRDLLVYADRSVSIPDLRESKRQEKVLPFPIFSFESRPNPCLVFWQTQLLLQLSELSKNLRELKLILYGNSDAEPVAEACAQLTQEFFKGDTLRRLITMLQYLNLEVTHLISLKLKSPKKRERFEIKVFFLLLLLLGKERCYTSGCKSSEATSQFTPYCLWLSRIQHWPYGFPCGRVSNFRRLSPSLIASWVRKFKSWWSWGFVLSFSVSALKTQIWRYTMVLCLESASAIRLLQSELLFYL